MEKTPDNIEKNALPLKEMPDGILKMEMSGCVRALSDLQAHIAKKILAKKNTDSTRGSLEAVAQRLEVLLIELEKRDSMPLLQKTSLQQEARKALDAVIFSRKKKKG